MYDREWPQLRGIAASRRSCRRRLRARAVAAFRCIRQGAARFARQRLRCPSHERGLAGACGTCLSTISLREETLTRSRLARFGLHGALAGAAGLGCSDETKAPSSAKFVRDSLSQDSLSRTIDTDSLVKLYVTLMRSPGDTTVEQEITCENFRLGWRHGFGPSLMALIRVQDSLAASHGEVWSRFNEGGYASVMTMAGPDLCGVADEPPAPPFIGNIPTDILYDAPSR